MIETKKSPPSEIAGADMQPISQPDEPRDKGDKSQRDEARDEGAGKLSVPVEDMTTANDQ